MNIIKGDDKMIFIKESEKNKILEDRNEKIEQLKVSEEVILSKYDLQLLMCDVTGRADNGTYYDYTWFKIYYSIACKEKEKYEIEDNLILSDLDLNVMELGETKEEVKKNIARYAKILEESKDTIGVKLSRIEIINLLKIINNCKPTLQQNEDFILNMKKDRTPHIVPFHK